MSNDFDSLFDKAFTTALKDEYDQVQPPSPSYINASWETTMNKLEEMNERTRQEYLGHSIQSVLHNNRNRIHLFMDSYKCHDFIRELSDEIIRRTHRLEEVYSSSVSKESDSL